MAESFEGQCQCGEVHYLVTGTPLTLFACHCIECQRQSSSAFGMALWIKDPAVQILSGALKEWIRETPSGRRMACRFCPTCGTRLFHQMLGQSEIVSIKPGTLNTAGQMQPVGHIWIGSKQKWVQLGSESLQYTGNPETFEQLLAAWKESHA